MRRACRACGRPVDASAPEGRCARCIHTDPKVEHRVRTGAWSMRDQAEQRRFRKELMARAGGRCEYRIVVGGAILRCPATTDLQAHHGHGRMPDLVLCREHHRAVDEYAR